jgi:spermidine dehydrogenase
MPRKWLAGSGGLLKGHDQRTDEAIGLDASIRRRDFLNGALLGAGGMWAAKLSPAAMLERNATNGLPVRWGGNTEEVFTAGHAIRDGRYSDPNIRAEDTGEVFDLAVVGGGFSGLAAAYYFNKAKDGRGKVIVLENHKTFGGNASRDEFVIRGKSFYAPRASVVSQDLPPAFAPKPPVDRIFDELGIDLERIRIPKEASDFSVFRDGSAAKAGRWYGNLFEAPMTDGVKKDFMAFFESVMPFYGKSDWQTVLRDLDRFTFKEYVQQRQKWDSGLFAAMLPDIASFFSFPDQVSAAMVYAQYGGGPRPLYSFPGGNSGFLRHLVKQICPDAIRGGASTDEIIRGPENLAALDKPANSIRIRLGSTAVIVGHEGKPENADRVRVVYSQGGRLRQLRAKRVVMAGGGYVTKHIVRGVPEAKIEAYNSFKYAPVIWANVAVNNSRAIDKSGINYISTYQDGFGVMLVLYEKMSRAGIDPNRDPSRPNVLGIGAPRFYPGLPIGEQATRGRNEIFGASFLDYERKIRLELARLLGPWGFDPKKDIEGLSISRWGHHGYIFPYPGVFTDGKVERAKMPFGRIAFAHTDLERFSHMIGAIGQGYRAVQDVLDLT